MAMARDLKSAERGRKGKGGEMNNGTYKHGTKHEPPAVYILRPYPALTHNSRNHSLCSHGIHWPVPVVIGAGGRGSQ